MKIILQKKKLALWLCAVFVIMFIGCMVLMFHVQRQNFSSTYKENLQVLANEKALLVNTFLESQKEKLLLLTSMNIFKEAILHPNDVSKLGAAKRVIDGLGGTASIFTNKGILIYANNAPAGADYSKDPYFVLKDKKILFGRYYDVYEKKDFYIIIGPVYDNQEKDKVIGAIGFHLALNKISDLMKETLESHTSEIYLIDETGLLLSDSKFIGQNDKKGVLIQEIKSDEAKVCLEDLKKYQKDGVIEKHEEKILSYLNYMGNEVFGAHAYVPQIMGCVIAEESAKKVLGIFDVKLY